MKKQTVIVVLIAIHIALTMYTCNRNQKYNLHKDLYDATQDTLHLARNELGQQTAKIEVLTVSNEKQLKNLKTKDSTIIKLQAIVKDYKGKLSSATVLVNSTSDNGSTSTTITNSDTVYKDSCIHIYPTYTTIWDEKWSSGSIIANRDSISRSIYVNNEYEITQGWERQGFLKPRKNNISIKNLNPNTSTEEFRTVTIEEPKKKFNISIQVGYGITGNGLSPYIGIGGGYNILSF